MNSVTVQLQLLRYIIVHLQPIYHIVSSFFLYECVRVSMYARKRVVGSM